MSTRFLSAIAILASILPAACAVETAKEAAPRVAAVIAPVTRERIPRMQAYAGAVRASNIAAITSRIVGDVAAVHVTAGDRVVRGQLLIEIAARDAAARHDRARAGATEAARAADSASAAARAAEATAAIAEKTWRRYTALRDRKSVSPHEYDEVEARYRAAAAELERARSMRDALLAQRAAAAAAEREAATVAGYTSIRAPFDGVVSARFVDPGAQAAPGIPLLTIDNVEGFRVETHVDETTAVTAGSAVTIESGSSSVPARVTHVVPSLDAASRTALVKIDLPDGPWRSGAYARVIVSVGERDALLVPAAAIARRGNLTSVFAVGADGIARLRLVTVGTSRGERIEVLSGLSEGERVVAERSSEIREGVRIGEVRS